MFTIAILPGKTKDLFEPVLDKSSIVSIDPPHQTDSLLAQVSRTLTVEVSCPYFYGLTNFIKTHILETVSSQTLLCVVILESLSTLPKTD